MAGKRRRKSQLIGNEANTFTEKYLPHKQQEKLNSHIEREQPQGIKHAQHSTSDVTHKLATVKAKGMHAANDEVFEHVDSHIMESMREELGHDLDFEFQLHPDLTQTHAEARLHDRELTRPTDRPSTKDKIDTHQAIESRKRRYIAHGASQPSQTNHTSDANNTFGFFNPSLNFDGRGALKPEFLAEMPTTKQKTTKTSSPPAAISSFWNRTANRAWGLIQMMGGITEITTALSAAGISEGALSIPAIALGGHGIDDVTNGWLNLWNGSNQKSTTERAIIQLTGSESAGQLAETGIGLLSDVGIARGAQAAAFEARKLLTNSVPNSSQVRQIASISKLPSSTINETFISPTAIAEGWLPPYLDNRVLREVTLAGDVKFLRAHMKENIPVGRFIFREKELSRIGDITPESVRHYLGLKDTPAYISEVYLKQGDKILMGRIGPQPNFGLEHMSGYQYQLRSFVSEERFANTRNILELSNEHTQFRP